MNLQENTFFLPLTPRNVPQYPLHHVTYAPAKFEVASPNGLGGDAFTRNLKKKLGITMFILTPGRRKAEQNIQFSGFQCQSDCLCNDHWVQYIGFSPT